MSKHNEQFRMYADAVFNELEISYKQGWNDAIDEFKERLLDLCDGGEECIECVGGKCSRCLENSVDYSSIVDLAEELKEQKND